MKIVKIPYDKSGLGKTNGCCKAPEKIIKQLNNFFLNESGQKLNYEIDEVNFDKDNIEQVHDEIYKYSKKNKEKSIYLGGDHSVSYSIIKGLKNNFKDFKLIIFDAHPDLMKDFKTPTHESYLRELIDQKIIKPSDIYLLGIRNFDLQEINFLDEQKIKYFSMKEIFEKGIKTIVNELNFGSNIYISIDIDVVDPVQAIGTGYIEHGGISSRELIYCLEFLKKKNKIIGCDIVEVNPKKDINNITSSLAAKLIIELV
jgi:agmatinase